MFAEVRQGWFTKVRPVSLRSGGSPRFVTEVCPESPMSTEVRQGPRMLGRFAQVRLDSPKFALFRLDSPAFFLVRKVSVRFGEVR